MRIMENIFWFSLLVGLMYLNLIVLTDQIIAGKL